MQISEVSKKYCITSDTLRYYEKIELIPCVKRDKNGIRDFDEYVLKRLEFIICMRKAGLSIELLSKYAKLVNQGDDTLFKRRELLLQEKENLYQKLAEIKTTIETIEHKIKIYNQKIGDQL